MERSGFGRLLSRNVIHIHEMILLSLDYETFKNCQGVCRPWNRLLASESFCKKAYSVFCLEMDQELLLHTKEGNVEKVKSMLTKGANPNCERNGLNPLVCGAFIGHTGVVKLLLDHGVDPNTVNVNGSTPLQMSASKGHTDVMKLLIKAGALPDLGDQRGNTPLHFSALSSHKSVVKILLDSGAHPMRANKRGVTPLALAIAQSNGNLAVVKLMIGH